ncbi:hypothetical protein ACU6XP_08375 [Klebsiella aerogenes]|uniref:hypothetical protein n=1 Tax=Klebsiella sp. 141198 TaxID=3020036 RepID=UPI003AFC261B
MIEHIKKSLVLNIDVEKNLASMSPRQLEVVKQRLTEYIGARVGGHTFSIPMVGGILFAIFCFVMPQITVWEIIFRLNGWPDYAILAAAFPSGVLYSILICIPGFLTARGRLIGLKSFLCVIAGTGIIAIAFFLFAVITFIMGGGDDAGDLIGAILGVFFIAIGIKCLNTVMFTKTIAFYLLNRVSRQQIKLQHSSGKYFGCR